MPDKLAIQHQAELDVANVFGTFTEVFEGDSLGDSTIFEQSVADLVDFTDFEGEDLQEYKSALRNSTAKFRPAFEDTDPQIEAFQKVPKPDLTGLKEGEAMDKMLEFRDNLISHQESNDRTHFLNEFQNNAIIRDVVTNEFRQEVADRREGLSDSRAADLARRIPEGFVNRGAQVIDAIQNFTNKEGDVLNRHSAEFAMRFASNPENDGKFFSDVFTGAGGLAVDVGVTLTGSGVGTLVGRPIVGGVFAAGLLNGLSSGNEAYVTTLELTGDKDAAFRSMIGQVPRIAVETGSDVVVAGVGKLFKGATKGVGSAVTTAGEKRLRQFMLDAKDLKGDELVSLIRKNQKDIVVQGLRVAKQGAAGGLTEGFSESVGTLIGAMGFDESVREEQIYEALDQSGRNFLLGMVLGSGASTAIEGGKQVGTNLLNEAVGEQATDQNIQNADGILIQAARAELPMAAIFDANGVMKPDAVEIVQQATEAIQVEKNAEAQTETDSELLSQEERLDNLSNSNPVTTPEQAQVAAIGDTIETPPARQFVPESNVNFDVNALIEESNEVADVSDFETDNVDSKVDNNVSNENIKKSNNEVDTEGTSTDGTSNDNNVNNTNGNSDTDGAPTVDSSSDRSQGSDPTGEGTGSVRGQDVETTPSEESGPEPQRDSANAQRDSATQVELTPRERVNRAFETSTDASGGDPDAQASRQIADGYRKAELVRALEGKPSQADVAAEVKRSKTLSRGREVRTREGSGKVISTPFGKVKVELDNGETKTFERDQIAFKTLNEQEAVESLREKAEAEISSREERKGIVNGRNNNVNDTNVDPDSTTDLDSTEVNEEGNLDNDDVGPDGVSDDTQTLNNDNNRNNNPDSGDSDNVTEPAVTTGDQLDDGVSDDGDGVGDNDDSAKDTSANPLIRQNGPKKSVLASLKTKKATSRDTIEAVSVEVEPDSDLARVMALAEDFGAKIRFFRGPESSQYNHDSQTIHVNVDSPRAAAIIIGHELAHHIQHTDPNTWNSLLEALGVKEGQTLDDLIANNDNVDADRVKAFDRDFLAGQKGYKAEEKLHEFIAEVVGESLFDLTALKRFDENLPKGAKTIIYSNLAKAFRDFVVKLRDLMIDAGARRDALGVFGKDGMISAIQDVERTLRVADRYGQLTAENGINPEQYRRDIIHAAHRDVGSTLTAAEIDAKILLGEDTSVDYSKEVPREQQIRNVKEIEDLAETLIQAKYPLAQKEKLNIKDTNQIFDQLFADPDIVSELDARLNTEDGGYLAVEALTSAMVKLFEKTRQGKGKKLLMTRIIKASFISGGTNAKRIKTGSGSSNAGALLSFRAHSNIGHLTMVTRMISDAGQMAAEKILGAEAASKLAAMKENDNSTYNQLKRNAYKLWTMESSTQIENALSKLEKLLESPAEVKRSRESNNTATSRRILEVLKARGNENVTLDQIGAALVELSGAHPDLQAEIESAFDELTDIKAQERRQSFMSFYGRRFPQVDAVFENSSAATKLDIIRGNIRTMIKEGDTDTMDALARFSGRSNFDPTNEQHVEAVVQKSWQSYTKAVKDSLARGKKRLNDDFSKGKVSINTITKAMEKGILGDGSVDLHWNVIDAKGDGITFDEKTVEKLESLNDGIRKMANMGHQDAEAVAHMINEMSNILQDQINVHPKLSESFKSSMTAAIFGTTAGLSLAATSGASAFIVEVMGEISAGITTFNGARVASAIKNAFDVKGFIGQSLVKALDTYMTGVDTTNGIERRFDTTLDRNDILNKADTQANSARRRWKESVAAKNPAVKAFKATQAVLGFFQVFGIWRVFQGLDRITVDRSKALLNDARFIVRARENKLSKADVEQIREIASAKADGFRRLILDTMGDDVPDRRVNFMVNDMVTREVNLTLAKKLNGDLDVKSNVPASSQIRERRRKLRIKHVEAKSRTEQNKLQKKIDKLTEQLGQVDADERMLEASIGEAQASLGVNDEVAGGFGLLVDKMNNTVLGGFKKYAESFETKEGKTNKLLGKTLAGLWSITPTLLGAIRTPAYAADRYATYIPAWGLWKYQRLKKQKGLNPLAMDDFALRKRYNEALAGNSIAMVGLIINVLNYLEEEEDRFIEITGPFPINDTTKQAEWGRKKFKAYSLHIHFPNLRRAIGRLFGEEPKPASGDWHSFGYGKGVFAPLAYPLIATDKLTKFALDTPTVDKTKKSNLALGLLGVASATSIDIFNASIPMVTAGTENWMSANEAATRLSEGNQSGITGRWFGRMTGNMFGPAGGFVRSGQNILYGDRQYADSEAFWYSHQWGRLIKGGEMFAEKYDMFGRVDTDLDLGTVMSRGGSPISWGGVDAQSVRDAKDLTANQKKGFEMLLNTGYAPLSTRTYKWKTFAEREEGFGDLTDSDWEALMKANGYDSKQDAYGSMMQTTGVRFFDHLVADKTKIEGLKKDVLKHSSFLDTGFAIGRAKRRFLQTEEDQGEYAKSRDRLRSSLTSIQAKSKKEWTSSTGFSSYRHLRKAVKAKDIDQKKMDELLPISIQYKKEEVLIKKKFGSKASVKKYNKRLWQARKDAYYAAGIKSEDG